jgi:hypothetical protein
MNTFNEEIDTPALPAREAVAVVTTNNAAVSTSESTTRTPKRKCDTTSGTSTSKKKKEKKAPAATAEMATADKYSLNKKDITDQVTNVVRSLKRNVLEELITTSILTSTTLTVASLAAVIPENMQWKLTPVGSNKKQPMLKDVKGPSREGTSQFWYGPNVCSLHHVLCC